VWVELCETRTSSIRGSSCPSLKVDRWIQRDLRGRCRARRANPTFSHSLVAVPVRPLELQTYGMHPSRPAPARLWATALENEPFERPSSYDGCALKPVITSDSLAAQMTGSGRECEFAAAPSAAFASSASPAKGWYHDLGNSHSRPLCVLQPRPEINGTRHSGVPESDRPMDSLPVSVKASELP